VFFGLFIYIKLAGVDRKTCVNADLADDFIFGFFPAFTYAWQVLNLVAMIQHRKHQAK